MSETFCLFRNLLKAKFLLELSLLPEVIHMVFLATSLAFGWLLQKIIETQRGLRASPEYQTFFAPASLMYRRCTLVKLT